VHQLRSRAFLQKAKSETFAYQGNFGKENAGSGSPGFGIEWRNRELEGSGAMKAKKMKCTP